MTKTYYDILGITRQAESDEIEKAYRKLRYKYKDSTKIDRCKMIKEAYTILSKYHSRKEYDDYLDNEVIPMYNQLNNKQHKMDDSMNHSNSIQMIMPSNLFDMSHFHKMMNNMDKMVRHNTNNIESESTNKGYSYSSSSMMKDGELITKIEKQTFDNGKVNREKEFIRRDKLGNIIEHKKINPNILKIKDS
jgi:DnaJ-class molecular chaperone